jgi:hypothetical protein
MIDDSPLGGKVEEDWWNVENLAKVRVADTLFRWAEPDRNHFVLA